MEWGFFVWNNKRMIKLLKAGKVVLCGESYEVLFTLLWKKYFIKEKVYRTIFLQ